MKDIYSEEKIREYRKKNWKEAIEDFENKEPYVMNKIKNIATNFEINESEIYNIISNTNDKNLKELFIAVRFSKDPKRQNIYERIFHDFLKERGRKLIKLPSIGPTSVFLTRIGLSFGSKNHTDSTKSLDFYENIRDKEIYYYHKYTEHGGGAQANQFNDLKTFLRLSNRYCRNNDDNYIFVAVADGPFYDADKMDYLAQIADEFYDEKIFIVKWYNIMQKVY